MDAELLALDAEIARFAAAAWFKTYPPVVMAMTADIDERRLAYLNRALDLGADPDLAARNGTTAAKLAQQRGHLAALQALYQAGAKFPDRNWSPLHRAVLFGATDEVAALAMPEACAALDTQDWSPLILACAMGQTAMVRVLWPLTPQGARQVASGKWENALIMAVRYGNASLVDWLLDQGVPVDWPDRYGGTALLQAVGLGQFGQVETLLKRGAVPNPKGNISASLRDNPVPRDPGFPDLPDWLDHGEDYFNSPLDDRVDAALVRLLVAYGYPLDEVGDSSFPVAVGADLISDPLPSPDDVLDHGTARAGVSNPEKVAPPFWISQIRGGRGGYVAADMILGKGADHPHPVWSFHRFGRSATKLPDGRIVCVAGEHEDHYDDDFCIYADVTVLDGKGGVDHYIYPAADFPPTDFHTATLVGDTIWLIGSLGYPAARGDRAQVLALSVTDWRVRRVVTHGDDPGWINNHKAVVDGGRIVISGGRVGPDNAKQTRDWSFDPGTATWSRA